MANTTTKTPSIGDRVTGEYHGRTIVGTYTQLTVVHRVYHAIVKTDDGQGYLVRNITLAA